MAHLEAIREYVRQANELAVPGETRLRARLSLIDIHAELAMKALGEGGGR